MPGYRSHLSWLEFSVAGMLTLMILYMIDDIYIHSSNLLKQICSQSVPFAAVPTCFANCVGASWLPGPRCQECVNDLFHKWWIGTSSSSSSSVSLFWWTARWVLQIWFCWSWFHHWIGLFELMIVCLFCNQLVWLFVCLIFCIGSLFSWAECHIVVRVGTCGEIPTPNAAEVSSGSPPGHPLV